MKPVTFNMWGMEWTIYRSRWIRSLVNRIKHNFIPSINCIDVCEEETYRHIYRLVEITFMTIVIHIIYTKKKEEEKLAWCWPNWWQYDE